MTAFKYFGGSLHSALVHAVTAYDRKRVNRRDYNIYALPQYLARVDQVESDIAAGAEIRAAIVAGFSGSLLDAVLKAAGLPKHAVEESRGRVVYVPVKESAV